MRGRVAFGDSRPHVTTATARVAVTRAATRSDALIAQLERAGLTVHDVPLTKIARFDGGALDAAIAALEPPQWMVLTSATAVECVRESANRVGAMARVGACRLAVVGDVTARAVEQAGWAVTLLPERFTAEGLLDVMASRDDVRGARVLYPCARGSRDVLPDGLATLGAQMATLPCYESVSDPEGQRQLGALLRARAIDVVVVAAPSAVDALAEAVAPERAREVLVASIGPVTTKAAKHAGFRVVVEAMPSTSEALARAIVAWARGRDGVSGGSF